MKVFIVDAICCMDGAFVTRRTSSCGDQFTRGDAVDEVSEAIVGGGGLIENGIHCREIGGGEASAFRVFCDAGDEVPGKGPQVGLHDFFQIRDVFEGTAFVGAVGLDAHGFGVAGAQAADGIVALQGESERVHLPVAFRAGCVGAVPVEQLPHDGGTAEVRHESRDFLGRGRRRAEESGQRPVAADHRRGLDAVRGEGEDTALAEQAAAFRLRRENDADKLIPAAFERDTVEFRESLIHKEVVGVDGLANGRFWTRALRKKRAVSCLRAGE